MTGASDWERGVTLQQLEHDILDRPTASEAALKCLIVERPGDVTFSTFAEATNQRTTIDFGEALDATSKYGPEHWALMIQEEAGEVAGAVIGMLGMKKRKNHLTAVDVGKEIADVVAYCACLAIRAGANYFTSTVTFSEFSASVCRRMTDDEDVVALALDLQRFVGKLPEYVSGSLCACAGKAIGDVVVACARIAHQCGLDFQEIVRGKFNEVSDRVGSSVRL